MNIIRKIFLLLFLFLVFAAPAYAEEVQQFSSLITVNKNGTFQTKETIVYDFGTLERHGIFRFIPLLKTNKEGKQFLLNFSSSYPNTSEEDTTYKIKIGDPNKTITGVQNYTIPYTVGGGLTYFSDHDELYWNVTGNEWKVPIQNAGVTIQLPKETPLESIKVACYTGVKNSTEQNCETEVVDTQVAAYTTKPLAAGEGLTVVVSFPKGIVAVLEPTPYVPFSETLIGKIVGALFAIASFVWYFCMPIFMVIAWLVWGRDPKVAGPVSAWFDPPKTSDGRFLTAAETGSLIDEKVNTRDIVAAIVQLAQKGFLIIEERKKKDFYLVKTDMQTNSLQPFEQTLLKKLFQTEKEFRVKNSEQQETVTTVTSMIYQSLLDENYFQNNPKTIRTIFTIIAVVALFTFNIFLAIVAFLFGRYMPRKTKTGAEAASVAKSLKNFLVSQKPYLQFQAQEQAMFEKLMPYAIAFGVEKIWAERFKDIALAAPSWFHAYDSTHFSSIMLANALHNSYSDFSRAATPTSSSSGFSSGFSGGSSGGGGGGGGGGSW